MAKGKKAGKKLNKKQMGALLEDFFRENPGLQITVGRDLSEATKWNLMISRRTLVTSRE